MVRFHRQDVAYSAFAEASRSVKLNYLGAPTVFIDCQTHCIIIYETLRISNAMRNTCLSSMAC